MQKVYLIILLALSFLWWIACQNNPVITPVNMDTPVNTATPIIGAIPGKTGTLDGTGPPGRTVTQVRTAVPQNTVIPDASVKDLALNFKTDIDIKALKPGLADSLREQLKALPATGGTIYIPAGIYGWSAANGTLRIPGGVNIIGAGLTTTMIVATQQLGELFLITGTSTNSAAVRISGISFIGWFKGAAFDYSRTVISLSNIQDFRIDHCLTEGFSYAMRLGSQWNQGALRQSRGVIDHCVLRRGSMPYATPYGISVSGYYEKGGERLRDLGTREAIFIEDCYFLDLSHPTAAFGGGHYVARYNTFLGKNSNTAFPLDGHGPGFEDSGRGTRCLEIYNNVIEDQAVRTELSWRVIGPRAGGGVIFNNTFRNFRYTVLFTLDNTTTYQLINGVYIKIDKPDISNLGQYFFEDPPKSGNFIKAQYPITDQIHDYYIWGNVLENISNSATNSGVGIYGSVPALLIQKDRDYFLHAPSSYSPYIYPHPLTI